MYKYDLLREINDVRECFFTRYRAKTFGVKVFDDILVLLSTFLLALKINKSRQRYKIDTVKKESLFCSPDFRAFLGTSVT